MKIASSILATIGIVILTSTTIQADPAANPPGRYLAVSLLGTAGVSLIRTSDLSVVSTIRPRVHPAELTSLPNGRLFVFPEALRGGHDAAIDWDVATNRLGQSIGIDASYSGEFSPAHSRLYISQYGHSQVSVLDIANDNVIATIPTTQQVNSMAVDPSADELYVAAGAALTVFSESSLAQLRQASIFAIQVFDVAAGKVYLATGSSFLKIHDAQSFNLISETQIGTNSEFITRIRRNEDGSHIWALLLDPVNGGGRLVEVDTSNDGVVATYVLPTGSGFDFAVDETAGKAYVPVNDADQLDAIDLQSSAITTVAIGNSPINIAIVDVP